MLENYNNSVSVIHQNERRNDKTYSNVYYDNFKVNLNELIDRNIEKFMVSLEPNDLLINYFKRYISFELKKINTDEIYFTSIIIERERERM